MSNREYQNNDLYLQEEWTNSQSQRNAVTLAEVARDIKYIQHDVADVKKKINDDFITKVEFDPIKKIVYGLVGLVLTAVVGAALSFFLNK